MDKFYVQDKRNYVGNCILWWRQNGAGYTTNIDDAGVFTEDTLPINRETDIPWPKDYVDQHLRKTVDVQDVDNPLRGDVRYMNPRVRVDSEPKYHDAEMACDDSACEICNPVESGQTP